MTSPLFPCPGCHRHVRVGGSRCPFCATALPAEPEGLVPSAPPNSLSRAALFAFATTVAACSSPQAPPQTGTTQEVTASGTTTTSTPSGTVVETPPSEGVTVAAAYGAAPPQGIAIAPMYGGPAMMIDAGPAADATVADATATDVATADAASDAARRDARVRPAPTPRPDPGAMMVRYGAPPADFA